MIELKKDRTPYIRDGTQLKRYGKRSRHKSSKNCAKSWKAYIPVVLMILAFIVIIVALTVLTISPVLLPIYRSPVFRFLIAGIILFFTFVKAPPMPLFTKVALVFSALLFLYPLFISSAQVLLVLELVTLYCLIVVAFYHGVFEGREFSVLTVTTALLAINNFSDIKRYLYVEPDAEMSFWEVGLVFALITGFVYGWLAFKGKTVFKFLKLSHYILSILAAMVVGFYMSRNAANHLNYALDNSEPIQKQVEIVDFDISGGYRQVTEFIAIVDINGSEKELQISQSDFYDSKIGDYIEISVYNGFFGKPFYIVE